MDHVSPANTPVTRGSLLPVAPEEILHIEAQSNYVRITTPQRRYFIRRSLSACAAVMPPVLGLQVHRSHWVAFAAVADVTYSGPVMSLKLTLGNDIPVARGRQAEFVDGINQLQKGALFDTRFAPGARPNAGLPTDGRTPQPAEVDVPIQVVAWDLQGVFGQFSILSRYKNSLLKLDSQFAFRAVPVIARDPNATSCRTTYAVDTLHGLPRRITWAWSDTHGLQAIVKPALQPVDDTTTFKLIPISQTRYIALSAERQPSSKPGVVA